ncbi:MAG: GNAT family N-acetyltransferase, partial [Candidatus Hodarchaeales archaeon]
MNSKSSDRSGFQSFKLRRLFQKELPVRKGKAIKDSPDGFRYIVMELPMDRVPVIYEIKEKEIKRMEKILKVKPYDPEKEAETFTLVFNTILLTSPDPYRNLLPDEAKIFSPDGTFLAYLYGEPAGFAALTVEETEEGRIGVIAGIGVMPKFRGKKVALALATTIVEWFNKKQVSKLQCEVYEFNDISYNFISSLGFHEVGEMYLNQENVENPIRQIET